MYPYDEDRGNGTLVIVAIVFLIALIFAASKDEPTIYNHALVGDIVMSIGHKCEFRVLYNSDGILMEDLEGYNIECEKILVQKTVWRNTPKMHLLEFIVDEE